MSEELRQYTVDSGSEWDNSDASAFVVPSDQVGALYLTPRPVPFDAHALLGLAAGWEFVQRERPGQLLAYGPNTERLQRFAGNAGVRLKLIAEYDPSEGNIWLDDYEEALGQGFHPVGVANRAYYLHDICEDHYVAVALAQDAILEIVLNGDNVGVRYDKLTVIFSEMMLAFLASLRKGTWEDMGRKIVHTGALVTIGEDPGIATKIDRPLKDGLERLELL